MGGISSSVLAMRFSTRAMPTHGHATLSDSSPPDFDPVVHAEVQQAKRRWERCASVSSAWIAGSSPGNDERERTKEIRRRNADRRNECSAVANGHGRDCKRQAHIYRRSTVLVPRSLSSQGTQHQAFSSWDLAASLAGRRAGVTRPYLSQSSERSRAPVIVPRG